MENISIEYLEKKYGFKQGTKIFIDGGHACKDSIGIVKYTEGTDEFHYLFLDGGEYLMKNLRYRIGAIYSWPDEDMVLVETME